MKNISKIVFFAILFTLTFWLSGCSEPKADPVKKPDSKPDEDFQIVEEDVFEVHFGDELPVIRKAAERNNCRGDLFVILLAIRKAENGGPGKEFGVIHEKAWGTNLDTQAGWAAATVVKNHKRWIDAGKPDDFITFLGNRYCPPHLDPENENWQPNVRHWVRKLENS